MRYLLKKVWRNIKRFMEEKIKVFGEILSDAQNRLILGFVFIGFGGGLVASAYVRVPA